MAAVNSSKKFIDNFKRSRPATASLTQFLPFAAALMSSIDGEVHESEINKIDELGRKFLGKKFSKKELTQAVEEVSRLLTNSDESALKKWEIMTLETFAKMNLSSEGEKQALLAFFCELAFADGSIHKKEAQFVDRLSDAINFKNPFELYVDVDPEKTQLKIFSWHPEGTASSSMVVKILTDVMIQSGIVSVERKPECLVASMRVVTANKQKSMDLLGEDRNARKDAFLYFSREIRNALT